MKASILIIICSIFSLTAFAQNPAEETMGEIKNKAKEHFDKIKKDKGTLKGSGFTEYMRWEWFWSRRLNDARKLSDADKAYNTYLKEKNLNKSASNNSLISSSNYTCSTTNNQWTAIGPSNFPNANGSDSRGLGRMSFIRYHPSYGYNVNQTLFAGGNSGLWKSTNDGQSWSILGTDQLEVSACSDLAIDRTNPNIMYLASGITNFSVHRYNGATPPDGSPYLRSRGIMKSTDGGITWNYSGPLSNQNDFLGKNYRIAKIMLHPQNLNVIYTLVYYQTWVGGTHWESQIYKTTNAGATWTQIFQQTAGTLLDMEFHPTNPNIFYVAGYKLFKFTDTEANLSTLAPVDLTNQLAGWDGSDPGNLAWQQGAWALDIAVSPGAPNNVYVAGSGYEGTYAPNVTYTHFEDFSKYKYFWISTNSGASFIQTKPTVSSLGLTGLTLDVSPTANTIYFGRTDLMRSVDGGNSFQTIGSQTLHTDNREVKVVPVDAAKSFVCNDAGIYMSNDNGNSWNTRSEGLQIGWVYKLDIANTPNANSPDRTIVGLHDCTSSFTNHQQDGWNQLGGVYADNTWVAIDQNNPNIIYSETQYGSVLFRSTDGGITSQGFNIAGSSDWSTPYILDPDNTNRMIIGRSDVWSYNFSNNAQNRISDLNRNEFMRTLSIAPSNTNCMIAAYFRGVGTGGVYPSATYKWNQQLYRTTIGGGTNINDWVDITPKGTIAEGVADDITSVLIHPKNINKIWITYGTYGDFGGRLKNVLVSEDGGDNWSNYSYGLPYIPVNSIVMNNNRIEDEELYVGTDVGIFYRNK